VLLLSKCTLLRMVCSLDHGPLGGAPLLVCLCCQRSPAILSELNWCSAQQATLEPSPKRLLWLYHTQLLPPRCFSSHRGINVVVPWAPQWHLLFCPVAA
jgi:hypothetical protein